MIKCKKCAFWAKKNTVTPDGNIRKGFPQTPINEIPEDDREGVCGLRESNVTRGKDGCMSGSPKAFAAPEPEKKRGKK